MKKDKKKLIFISLNEINLEIVTSYLGDNDLPNLKLIKNNSIITKSESKYELLEPWIQWVSIYFGKKAEDHQIYRLGDGINIEEKSIFAILEEKGLSVGAISPMNIKNDIVNPSFFIPDPWTKTNPSKSVWTKMLHKSISELVKDNARSKINFTNYLYFFICFLKFSSLKNFFIYLNLFCKSFKKKWYRSLFLDFFLHDCHINFLKNKETDFSNIFFNSVAHIQHHYFFNSKPIKNKKKINPEWYVKDEDDPFFDALKVFDKIIGNYKSLYSKYDLMVATGLSQIPYDLNKFYYRMKNHRLFFNKFEINYNKIQELMSRDFLIHFNDRESCEKAAEKIKNIKTDSNESIFGDIQIKNNKLFISLNYNREILDQSIQYLGIKKELYLKDFVDFVAIKNGMHDGKGYLSFLNKDLKKEINIWDIKNLIINYFNEKYETN